MSCFDSSGLNQLRNKLSSSDRAWQTLRPAVTNSSVVVPAGSLQVENGFLETSSQGQNVLDGPESLVRFGVATRTELRFTVPDYFYNLTASGGSGFGDVAIGVKQTLGPTHGFDISVILFLSFPTGANGVSSGGYDPGLPVPWSRALSTNWTAAGMFSVYWPTQGRTRNVTGESTFLVDRQLTKPWDAFIEYAGDFPENGGPLGGPRAIAAIRARQLTPRVPARPRPSRLSCGRCPPRRRACREGSV